MYHHLNGAVATQSSQWGDRSAERAIDDNGGNDDSKDTCAETRRKNDPWRQVDLQSNVNVTMIRIANRAGFSGRNLRDFSVLVDGVICAEKVQVAWGKTVDVPGKMKGRIVKVTVPGENEVVNFCDFRVYEHIAS